MSGIVVDGARPAVAVVSALPRSYRLTTPERMVLMALACDSYDGVTSAPGYSALAGWTGLSQGVLTKALRSLCVATEHRPALLAKTSVRGRVVTEWRFLVQPVESADRFDSPQPVVSPDRMTPPEPVGQPVGEPVGTPDDTLPFPSLENPLPPTQRQAVEQHETEQAEESAVHEFEPDARRALAALDLRLNEDKLLATAYRLGHGDPWAGYKQVKHRTEHVDLTGVRSRSSYLWKVLEPDAPKPRDLRAPTGPAECEEHVGWPMPCIKCAEIAKEQQTEDAA